MSRPGVLLNGQSRLPMNFDSIWVVVKIRVPFLGAQGSLKGSLKGSVRVL